MAYTPVKGLWKANASESVPEMSSLTSGGFPTSGDPRKGTQPTVAGAAWFYLMDQMRLSVIAAAALEVATPPDAGRFLEALRSWGWTTPGTLPGTVLKDGAIGTAQLAKGAVTPEKMSAEVLLADAQTLTEPQKKQARTNIGMPDFYKAAITANGGVVPG